MASNSLRFPPETSTREKERHSTTFQDELIDFQQSIIFAPNRLAATIKMAAAWQGMERSV
ncbi:MAG: hypothetical protein DWI13_00460 [Planctomycetota bacterium]|nr:MAG: hypothetical protein DWI13_00460 [Planctomycetota bacterium]